jgi:hypothetical protein
VKAREALPLLCLAVLAICVSVMQTVDDPPEPEPRCEYKNGDLPVSIVVSSEKECDRIKRARGESNEQEH